MLIKSANGVSTTGSGLIPVVDHVGPREWDAELSRFRDASIYQSWAYGAVSWGEKNLSHLRLKRDGETVGMAQFRILRLPVLGSGIAYLRWGPLCRLGGGEDERGVLAVLFEAIATEYGKRRGLLVRIVPNVFEGTADGGTFQSLGVEAGFQPNAACATYRTILVDLAPSPGDIRKRLDQKWRNQLNAAQRNGLRIVEGTSDELFARFSSIYRDMLARKQFATTVDIDEFSRIQCALPEHLKMIVLLCEKDGRLMAGVVASAVGQTGIYLLGATSAEGMKAKGSYLLQWQVMQRLRERGCSKYDLGGINPKANPGVYHFKQGFGGQEVWQLPRFTASGTRLSTAAVMVAERLRECLAKLKSSFRANNRAMPSPSRMPQAG